MQARWMMLGAALLLVSTNASAQAIFRLDQGKLPTAPLAGEIKYYGGRVISHVKIIEVAWGSGVDATYMTKLQGFYTAIVTSPFMDWMSEYDTLGLSGFADLLPGSEQHIGRGTVGGSYVITPANGSATLTDADIQTELAAQLTSAALPAPSLDKDGNVDSLYMIDFPPGTTITLLTLQSCSSFGAYHFTLAYQGMSVPYGVHPSCGYSFDTSTIIHSHELAEAMTDTEVGLVETNTTSPSARPLGWVTLASTAWNSAEIADLCQGKNATVAGYMVQKVWSSYAQACVAEIPICNGVLVPPACRPCNDFDSENACPNACATTGPKTGQCVTCTSKHAGACTGATPTCDDATYTCVACVTHADCTTPTAPTCDPTTHTCRGCDSNAECGDAGVCDLASDGTKNQCVGCDDDSECGASEQCTAHTCTPKPMPDAGAEVGDAESAGGDGCSCTLGPTPARTPLAALFVGLAALVRRRRARRGSHARHTV